MCSVRICSWSALVLLAAATNALGATWRSDDGALARAAAAAERGTALDVFRELSMGAPGRDGEWVAENAARGLSATFRGEGVSVVVPDDDGRHLRVEMTLVAWGRPSSMIDAATARVSGAGTRVELDRGDVVEWYHNRPEGLEQGFTLLAAPPKCAETTGVELRLRCAGDLRAVIRGADSLAFVDSSDAVKLDYTGLRAWDATGRALDARLVAAGEWVSLLVDEEDAQYPITVDPLIAALEAKLLDGDDVAHKLTGTRVAIDGDTAVVVGQRAWVDGPLRAYTFERIGGAWARTARILSPGGLETFGDVELEGDRLAIGKNPLSGVNGSIHVFERAPSGWTEVFYTTTGSCCTWLGESVSLAGDRLAVADDEGGALNTRVFRSTATGWVTEAHLPPSGGVALRDDLLVISKNPAPYWGSPSIVVYQRVGTTWSSLATVLALPNGQYPVAIDEEHTIAVGAPNDSQAGANAGAVYLLRRDGASWVLWEKILSPHFPSTTGFGARISFENGTLAVGCDLDDGAASNAGATYLYRRNGGWNATLQLFAPDAGADDRFGADVDLSGDELLVGAPNDDDLGPNVGAGYVFEIAYDAQVYCTAKVNSLGCLPAVEFVGVPSATSASAFVITARNVINQKSGLFYYGLNGRAATPFQGGVSCVASPIVRTAAQSSGGQPVGVDCSGTYAIDFNAHVQSGLDPNLVSGAVVNGQFWTRDGGAASGTGLSDAIEFTLQP